MVVHNGSGSFQPPQRSARLIQHVMCLIAALSLAAMLTPAAQAQPRSAPLPGSFASGPCPIPAVAGITIDCGTLTVAEARGKANGKTIQLAVAILRSPNRALAREPALFLQGGPGGATLVLAPVLARQYAATLSQRDIVLIDQRGTGYSKPALNCGAPLSESARIRAMALETGDRPAVLQQQYNALLACGAAFKKAGIDLTAYNSVESAADLEDLRVALGYSAWNIIGVSYGSRLALTAMEYRPTTIRSVVLDSAYPRQANFHIDTFSGFDRSLNALFRDCETEFACLVAYPNLAATYDAMIARLNTTPAQIKLVDPTTQKEVYVPVSGNDIAAIVFSLFYDTTAIPVIPLVIRELAKGNYALLVALFNQPTPTQPTSSLGTLVAVQCNEDVTFASAQDFVVARDTYRRAAPLAFSSIYNEGILDVCAAWGLGTPAGVENTPVSSDIPTLIVRGAYDHVTQPDFGAIVGSTLSRSFVLDPYPRGGHVSSIASPCEAGAIAQFITNPLVRPDTSCIPLEAPQQFLIP